MAQTLGLWRWQYGAFAAVLVLVAAAPSLADDPTADLQREADRLEKAYQWQAAGQVYARLAGVDPGESKWTDGLRRCEQQARLTRRYSDKSFRDKILTLDYEKAAELYGEVVAQIETNYVDEVNLNQLVAKGLENLDLALQNPIARAYLVPGGAKEDVVARFRKTLRQRWGDTKVKTALEAQEKVRQIASGARLALGASQTAIMVEFSCAACEALDDNSGYLSPDRLTEVLTLVDEDVAGIGIELRFLDNQLVVTGIAADGPAALAGVQVNDRLLKIDGLTIDTLSVEEAAIRLLGKNGTAITLELQSALEAKPRRLEIKRQVIDMPSILAARIIDAEAGVGYIQVAIFQRTTPEELDLAIVRLSEQGMRALILDLRGNPGGSFAAAVRVADRFINEGILVSTRGRMFGSNEVYRAEAMTTLTIPLVVLIDGESASASEVVAGAIKDHRRGLLVGQKSYGKGSVQHVFTLQSAPAGIRLTTGKFYSPLDKPYQGSGVVPDLLVDRSAGMSGMDSMMGMMDEFEVALQTARRLLGKG